MIDQPRRRLVAAIAGLSGIGAAYARAEIHDYMILRLVYLNTSCGLVSLERADASEHHRRFKVVCKNISAYPEGLTVLCTDLDDDRHCRIETEARAFRSLDLVRPRDGEKP